MPDENLFIAKEVLKHVPGFVASDLTQREGARHANDWMLALVASDLAEDRHR